MAASGRVPRLLAFLICTFLALGGSSAFGQTFEVQWDPTSSGGSVLGGSGTWDTTSAQWWDPDNFADVNWSNNGNPFAPNPGYPYDAYFLTQGATAGTIALATPITVGNMYFEPTDFTKNFTLTGSTLTLANQDAGGNTAGIIDIGSQTGQGGIAVINSVVASGSNGLTLTGNGMLVLGNVNTGLTGPVTVSGGTIYCANTANSGNSVLGYASSITINNGGAITVDGFLTTSGGAYNAFVGGQGGSGPIIINQGGLLAQTTALNGGGNNNVSNNLGTLLLNGGTISSTTTSYDSTWNFRALGTTGNGNTSYIVGPGDIDLAQHLHASTVFNIVAPDQVYMNSILTSSPWGTNSSDSMVLTGGGTLTMANANAAVSNGGKFVTPVILQNGTIQVANASALSGNLVDTTPSGALNFGAISSATLGGLAGSGSVVLQNASAAPVTLSVGNGVFGGNLSGPGGLTHTGGLLMLTAPQSYGGPTIVTGGVLQINNPTISGFGNGAGWTFSTSAASNSTAGQRGVNGDTATTTSNGVGSTATTMWYNTPLPLGGNTPWTATFSFDDLFGNGADGTCFVLQNAGNAVFSGSAAGGYQGLAGILTPTSPGNSSVARPVRLALRGRLEPENLQRQPDRPRREPRVEHECRQRGHHRHGLRQPARHGHSHGRHREL